ncbi:hypothetical protein Tco_0233636 [Tanacetum coccineum]
MTSVHNSSGLKPQCQMTSVHNSSDTNSMSYDVDVQTDQAIEPQSYALSWKPCQGDSLNLPDHRTLLKDIDDIFGRNLQILEDLEVVGCLKTQGAVQHTILLKTPYWPESTEQISGKFLIS